MFKSPFSICVFENLLYILWIMKKKLDSWVFSWENLFKYLVESLYPNIDHKPDSDSQATSFGATTTSNHCPRGCPLGYKSKPKPPIFITWDNSNTLQSHVLKVSNVMDIVEEYKSSITFFMFYFILHQLQFTMCHFFFPYKITKI